jgi:hypothetical protein
MNRLATYIVIAATVIVSVAIAFFIAHKRKFEED